MFFELTNFLTYFEPAFSVFNYLTVRALFAIISSMFITLILGRKIINILKKHQIKQIIRSDGPTTHHIKAGTPTMGGLLIMFSFITSILIWSDLKNIYLWIVIFTAISFSLIGFIDDYMKLKNNSSRGLKSNKKFALQSIVAIMIILFLIYNKSAPINTDLLIPFIKSYSIEIGFILFAIIAYLTIVGTSNAVNLTDGLDGLAIMPVIIIAGALAVFSYITGNYSLSSYLNMEFISGTEELFVICAALAGSGFGFLWFNTYPADIFMGDVGSLSLGAILAVIAVIIRQEILFFLMCGIFVAEALSVIMQVGYYKITQKRIFLMSPLHHHFEKKGISETKITVRFWIVTLIFVLISLASIKIR